MFISIKAMILMHFADTGLVYGYVWVFDDYHDESKAYMGRNPIKNNYFYCKEVKDEVMNHFKNLDRNPIYRHHRNKIERARRTSRELLDQKMTIVDFTEEDNFDMIKSDLLNIIKQQYIKENIRSQINDSIIVANALFCCHSYCVECGLTLVTVDSGDIEENIDTFNEIYSNVHPNFKKNMKVYLLPLS